MAHHNESSPRLTRRAFEKSGSLLLLGAGLGPTLASNLLAAEPSDRGAVRVGLVTDLHYADKDPAGSRYYRETLTKFNEAAEAFREANVDFVVSLGDLIDSGATLEAELGNLTRMAADMAELTCDKHYVMGNHCVEALTKEEFLGEVGQEESWYSFDNGDFHFVVLDACFNSAGEPYGRNNSAWNDANLPAKQLEWLAEDLASAAGPAIAMIHQRLDGEGDYTVKNAAEARQVLEEAGNVRLVLQGHSHANDLAEINGISYCVLAAMIEGSGAENNGYSLLDLFDDGSIRLTGFRRQENREWS